MIQHIERGVYELSETKHGVKLLHLHQKSFAWIDARRVGEILILTTTEHPKREILSTGVYHLYDVEDEPMLSDQLHIELQVGEDRWQGYLLPTGFPTKRNPRKRIIPTHEVITANPLFIHIENVLTSHK